MTSLAVGAWRMSPGRCTPSAKPPGLWSIGRHDVLCNNKLCVVVEPGVVERLLKQFMPMAEYVREGKLYFVEKAWPWRRRLQRLSDP